MGRSVFSQGATGGPFVLIMFPLFKPNCLKTASIICTLYGRINCDPFEPWVINVAVSRY